MESEPCGYAFASLDRVFFITALRQVEHYEAAVVAQERPLDNRGWEIGYSAASLVMTCAAMEAHANYLGRSASRGRLPNLFTMSRAAWDRLEGKLPTEPKWIFVSTMLTGRQILDPGRAPFQQLCAAVTIRNNFIAHLKPTMLELRTAEDVSAIMDDEFPAREVQELTIANAKSAIDAARPTVTLVYSAMAREPPDWAKAR